MLVKIDSAQLEWRGAVWLSGDKTGIAELLSGEDIHALNQRAFDLGEGDKGRLTAKRYLFRTIFRGSGWAFANDPDFSHVSKDPEFWDEVNTKFYKKYEGLDKWHQKLAREVAAGRSLVSPFGRHWKIPLNKDGSIPWTLLSNYPVQGSCADLMMIARISLHRRLSQSGLVSRIVSTVHDDIKVDAPTNEVEQVAKTAIEVFNDIPKNVRKLFNIDLPIPFPGEVKIGHNLKEMEKYEDYSRRLISRVD